MGTRISLLIFLSFFIVITSCQQQSVKIEPVLQKAEVLLEQYPDSALVLLEEIPTPESLKKSLYYQYYLLHLQAKYKSYKDITTDTLVFSIRDYYHNKNDIEKTALASFYSGRVFQELKKYEKALQQFLDANQFLKHSQNFNLKGLCQNAIGDIYSKQQLKDKAIIHYKMAKEYFHHAENIKNEIITCKLIGNCLLTQEKANEAFIYYNEALHLTSKYKYKSLQASILMNIGVAYQEVKNFEQAKIYFKKATEYSTDSVNSAKLAANFAHLYELQGKNDSAIVYLQKALNYLPQEYNNYIAANIYKTWSVLEENNKNYKGALNKYRQYNKHLAQIISDNKNSALLEIEKKYNLQRIENQNKQLLIERQRLMLVFLSLIILLIVLIFYLSKRSTENRRRFIETEQKVEQLTKLARSFDEKEESFRNVLIRHFDIIRKVALIEGYIKKDERKRGEHFLRKINEIVYGQKDLNWEMLYKTLNNISNGFFEELKNKFPKLNDSEFQICCLTYIGFNNTEIAIFLNYSLNTIPAKKNIIRKKLGIQNYGNIEDFMKKAILD